MACYGGSETRYGGFETVDMSTGCCVESAVVISLETYFTALFSYSQGRCVYWIEVVVNQILILDLRTVFNTLKLPFKLTFK